MVRQITEAESYYIYWSVRVKAKKRVIDGLTVPNVPEGQPEPDDWRENRLMCLDAHCQELEVMQLKVKHYKRLVNKERRARELQV